MIRSAAQQSRTKAITPPTRIVPRKSLSCGVFAAKARKATTSAPVAMTPIAPPTMSTRHDPLELRVHMRTLTFDAAIFDFDETMIELEAQHTAASEALCRELGGDYRALPDAF